MKTRHYVIMLMITCLVGCAARPPRTQDAPASAKAGPEGEHLPIIRLYKGAALPRRAVAVIQSSRLELRSPEFTKPGVAFVCGVDRRPIDLDRAFQIECLPGKHEIKLLVQFQFEPDDLPAGTLAVSNRRADRTVELEAGGTYGIIFNSNTGEAGIAKIEGMKSPDH